MKGKDYCNDLSNFRDDVEDKLHCIKRGRMQSERRREVNDIGDEKVLRTLKELRSMNSE